LVENNFPILWRVRLLDWQVSAAGQIFAPRQLLSYKDVMNAENAGAFFCPASPKAPTVGALIHAIHGVMQKSAFMPSMAISRRRQAYTDGFTASCQASYRTLNKAHSSRRLFITKS